MRGERVTNEFSYVRPFATHFSIVPLDMGLCVFDLILFLIGSVYLFMIGSHDCSISSCLLIELHIVEYIASFSRLF